MLGTKDKKQNEIVIFPDEMKKIARYEEDFHQFHTENLLRYSFPMRYRMTVEDLQAALLHIKFSGATVQEVMQNWLMPLVWLWDLFGLNVSCGIRPVRYSEKEMVHLPDTDKEVFERVWYPLEKAWENSTDTEVSVNYGSVLQDSIDCLTFWLEERDTPLGERHYPEIWQKAFIRYYAGNSSELSQLSRTELDLCAGYTDYFCAKSYLPALQLKAYSCYGGNILFGCDWLTSCNLLQHLLDMTDDAVYANSLGYIYYYGRINKQVPQYELAFRMFAQGAANGIIQSVYKLGDMYLHGYGCKQSNHTAAVLYKQAYKRSLKEKTGELADASLRMARVYIQGIGVDVNQPKAYEYLLTARTALHRKTVFRYGDRQVWQEIRQEIAALRNTLPEGYFRAKLTYDNAWFFQWCLEDAPEVFADMNQSKDGTCTVTLKRAETASAKMFLEGRLDTCEFLKEITFTMSGVHSSWQDNTGKWRYDRVQWSHVHQYYEFLKYGKVIGWLKCLNCTYQPTRSVVNLARVRFTPNGKTYDYLCDLPEIKTGDRVVVPGNSVVEVTAVWHCALAELPLPYHYYKKVLKKEPNGSSSEEDR